MMKFKYGLSYVIVVRAIMKELKTMFVKGIKRGRTIELLEDIHLPDNQEVLVEIKEINDFWSALQDFRERVDLENIDDDTFENLRDKSPGREVNL